MLRKRSALITNRLKYCSLLLSSSGKSHSIHRLERIHTYQIFEFVEIFQSVINLVLVLNQLVFIHKIISQLRDFLHSDQSTMMRESVRTTDIVKWLISWVFCWNLFTAEHIIAVLSLFVSFLLLSLVCGVGWVSSNTFDVDVLSFLSGLFFLLKRGEIDLLELVLLIYCFRRGWKGYCRRSFKVLFWCLRRWNHV